VAAVVSLSSLLQDRRLWRGKPAQLPVSAESTGHALLDAALPTGGWPEAALIEVLIPADGVGELRLVLPTLARLTQAGCDIALIAPPYVPFPTAWTAAGVDFRHVQIVEADSKHALWASEQCLRSGCLSAVLCWPQQVDDRALRRLQVAAESGRAFGFAFRDARAARNPSPAVLRVQLEGEQIRVLKCRGGLAPVRPIPFPHSLH
jgi:cell division inhibitor SulA